MALAALLLIVVVGAIAIGSRTNEGRTPVPDGELEPRPEPQPEPEQEIPWHEDAWVWEIYLRPDGRIVDETDTELALNEIGLVPIEVCPRDTIVLRIPEVARRVDALGFLLPPVTWLEPTVHDPKHGTFAWIVNSHPPGNLRRVQVGALVRGSDGTKRRIGFAVTLGSC